MFTTFKSKAAADVLMYEQHAKRILDLLHKDVKRGVITAAEIDGALAILGPAVEQARNREAAVPRAVGAPAPDRNDADDPESTQFVSFATRVYPLLAMLREARKQQVDVAWGI